MKTSKKIKSHTGIKDPQLKRRSAPLESKEIDEELLDGELTDDDFEALGPINLANDMGDDDQLKYWEALGDEWSGSEMEEYERHIDEE